VAVGCFGTGPRGGSAISTWLAAHYTKTTVGGSTVHDLTTPAAG